MNIPKYELVEELKSILNDAQSAGFNLLDVLIEIEDKGCEGLFPTEDLEILSASLASFDAIVGNLEFHISNLEVEKYDNEYTD